MGMKSSGGGEIIQVQGGHIVRSTGRKDRHSKVYTAKGPRDRRVRLSAYTAIQFYDVQDRLGYDRPSKAVDWLIKKAQSAIDKLAELPPWHPTATAAGTGETEPSAEMAMPEQSESSGYNFQLHNPTNESSSSFVPQSLDPDTMRSFFPTSSSASSINFQSYPPEIIPRTTAEDLCLSLHSFQDHANHTPSTDQMTLFAGGSAPVSFESNFQRMVSWGSEPAENRGGGSGFMFGSPSQQSLMFSSQRGPLQSSYGAPSVRAWDDIPMASADHRSRFGLPEFCLPQQIHDSDEHGVASDKPSSASTSSHH